MADSEHLRGICTKMRADIIKMAHLVGPERKAHPGPALSLVEVLGVLYHKVLTTEDRVVLSKGHGCLALYAALASVGILPESEYADVRSAKGVLQGHPVLGIPGVDATTGSLGHGLPIGIGLALSMQLVGHKGSVFVIVGDGELQEGLIWESALVAGSRKIPNLVVIVDANGFQSSGSVSEISAVEPITDKFVAFGWDVIEIDGHAIPEVISSLHKARQRVTPICIVAHTIKGHGVSFMEGNSFHQRYIDKEDLHKALSELGVK